MSWLRRRRGVEAFEPPVVVSAPATVDAPVAGLVSERAERALVVLAVHTQQLGARLEELEARLVRAEEAALDAGRPGELVDLRVNGARVAAEVVRRNVEIRAEMARIADARIGCASA